MAGLKHSLILRILKKSRLTMKFCTNSNKMDSFQSSFPLNVRVRFAPSPTGMLHLGGLRTALYNYLFTKKHGGKFILRIEDTDQVRLVPGAIEKLQEILKWIGLPPDEGPEAGGNYGPYIQSQRLHIYKDKVTELLKNETAYYCFCSEKRLQLLRNEAVKNRQKPKYDNKCRTLSSEEVHSKLKNKKPFVIRFKLPFNPETFEDLVYGRITINIAEQEGDPIIIKSDGYPTYHFANVVDDHLMKITHVLRGVEWQVSTVKHLQLYKAFGYTPPQFAHLPLIINKDGTKLSKRQGDVHLEYFKENGFFPEAILSFITEIGGGFDSDGERFRKLEDLIDKFSLELLKTPSRRLEMERLQQLNQIHICQLLNNKEGKKNLIKKLRNILETKFSEKFSSNPLQKDILDDLYLSKVLDWSKDRIYVLEDLLKPEMEFIWTLPEFIDQNLLKSFGADIGFLIQDLIITLDQIPSNSFYQKDLVKLLRKFCEGHSLKFNKFMQFMRASLSGLKEGPGVAEMMEILGKDITVKRLHNALHILSK